MTREKEPIIDLHVVESVEIIKSTTEVRHSLELSAKMLLSKNFIIIYQFNV